MRFFVEFESHCKDCAWNTSKRNLCYCSLKQSLSSENCCYQCKKSDSNSPDFSTSHKQRKLQAKTDVRRRITPIAFFVRSRHKVQRMSQQRCRVQISTNNNVAAVVEDLSYILRVDCYCEVWIDVTSTCRTFLQRMMFVYRL